MIFLFITYITFATTMNTSSTLSSQFLTIGKNQPVDTNNDDIEFSFSLCHGYELCWHLYLC